MRDSSRLLVVATLFAALLVACSDGGDSTPTATPPPQATATPSAPSICADTAVAEILGTAKSPDIIEASGLAVSRSQDDVIWAHNDSGDSARVFAMRKNGDHLGVYTLGGAEAIDWEDMAIGPKDRGDDADYLYLGDIGDNAAQRPDIVVYRVREPVVPLDGEPVSIELADVERLPLRYPDRPHDAETLMVDQEGDIYIVTKEGDGHSLVFRGAGIVTTEQPGTLEQVAEIDFSALRGRPVPEGSSPLALGGGHLATGGDISADGSVIAIRTYSTVWIWSRPEGASIADAFAAEPCEGLSANEAQGEAIALDPDGRGYVTTSEGTNPALNYFHAR